MPLLRSGTLLFFLALIVRNFGGLFQPCTVFEMIHYADSQNKLGSGGRYRITYLLF